MKIAVVDYGSGNLRSVYQAIKKVAPLNSDVWVTEDPNKVKEARLYGESSQSRTGRGGKRLS